MGNKVNKYDMPFMSFTKETSKKFDEQQNKKQAKKSESNKKK